LNHGWTRINTDENAALNIRIVVSRYDHPSEYLKMKPQPDLIRVHPRLSVVLFFVLMAFLPCVGTLMEKMTLRARRG
jgi:hypothetical protein